MVVMPQTLYECMLNIICMINKNISIREDQQTWIVENSINLSRFVQRRIDEVMVAADDGSQL